MCTAEENTTTGPQHKKESPIDVASIVVSAPSSANSKFRTVTPEIQQTINNCGKRSNSCVENKYKCTITSDRLFQLRKIVENATRDHKVFSIKAPFAGGWPIIRRELVRRNWLEKIEPAVKQKYSNMDDVTSNMPAKQDWESSQTYNEKCEKTVMSRMLQNFDVDFYWSMRKDQNDMQHRANTFKLMNRFSRSLFASKEGLALLLQQSYWYTEAQVACVNYPRVYVLGFPDHYNLFVDDFRMTACIGLLKWFVEKYETGDKHDIKSPDGKVPFRALQFAIDRCGDYIATQKHLDLDKDLPRVWDHEWEQFLTNYNIIVHQDQLFLDFNDPLPTVSANVKSTLKEIQKFWPQYDIDGMRNIWILKPGNKCRGRGIQLVKNISDVDKIMGLKVKYIVQKYIEKPLIIYQTKFDIRQWFMVTNIQPLTIWMYRDSYLRFSSQIFDLDNFHESLHLTNHAVQVKYTNMQQRNKALPDDNMWDCHSFKAYLKQIGCMEKWNEVVYPGMQQSIICAMLSSQDTMDRRQNTYELYGADFMLSEDFRPWLIEINCSPDLSFSTTVTGRMCPQCMEDIIKVVIDKKRDPTASTGLFEMVFKQNYPRTPPYLGMNLAVRGRRIFRNRTKCKDKTEKEKAMNRLRKHDLIKNEFIRDSTITKILPKLISPESYTGPIIEDFIEELHKSVNGDTDIGVDFVPAIKVDHQKKKNEINIDRVAKYYSAKCKTNLNFVCRRQNAKENIRETTSTSQSGLGLFKNWVSESKISSQSGKVNSDITWEEETASILRGKNIVYCSSNSSENNINKNYFNAHCLSAFDLNKLENNNTNKGNS